MASDVQSAYPSSDYPIMDVEQSEAAALRQYLAVIRKRCKIILLVFLSAVVLTAIVVIVMPRTYTAKTTVLIEAPGPRNLGVIGEHEQTVTQNIDDYYYETQYDILRSRSLAALVIRNLDLLHNRTFAKSQARRTFFRELIFPHADQDSNKNLSSGVVSGDIPLIFGVPPAAIDAYLRQLSVVPAEHSRLVVIGFSSSDPLLSAKIVNAHIIAYIQRTNELQAAASENAREVLEKKLVDLQARVEKSEAALNGYLRQRGIVAFAPDDKGKIVMERLTALNRDLTKAETQRITLEAEREAFRKSGYDSLPEVVGNPLVQRLKQELAGLDAQYAAMRNRYNPGYHPLDDLRAKVTESRKRLDDEIGHVVESNAGDYRRVVAQEQDLKGQIEIVKAEAMAVNDISLKEAVLAQEVDTNRQLYQSVFERMREFALSAEIPTSDVSVVDPAEPPRKPSSPRVTLSLALSAVLGLLGGIAAAFVMENLDDRIKTSEEVEQYLSLATLGVVPDFAELLMDNHSRQALPWVKNQVGMRGDRPAESRVGEMMVSPDGPSAAGEIYRMIRNALLFSQAGGAPRVLLVTSALNGEGKTLTALNTALAFAQLGRTILVDTDLRRPRCHEILGVSGDAGLTEVLVGQLRIGDVKRTTSAINLSLLSSGSPSPNPSDLLASKKMAEILAEVRSEFDYVILDSAPVLAVSDPLALATMVDGVILVIGSQTPKGFVRDACSRMRYVRAKILGVVLNQAEVSNPQYSQLKVVS
jgi:succinoglycan biosynthesis transport protein ExoP